MKEKFEWKKRKQLNMPKTDRQTHRQAYIHTEYLMLRKGCLYMEPPMEKGDQYSPMQDTKIPYSSNQCSHVPSTTQTW